MIAMSRLHFWCWWGWVAAVGLEVLDLCFLWLLAGVARSISGVCGVGLQLWDWRFWICVSCRVLAGVALIGGSSSGVGGVGLQLWDWKFWICVSSWVLAGVALNGGSISGDGGLWNCEVLG